MPDDARPEAAEIRGVSKVNITSSGKKLLLLVVEESHRESVGIHGSELVRLKPDGLQLSKTTPDRQRIDAKMNIRRTGLETDTQIVVYVIEGMDGLSGRAFASGRWKICHGGNWVRHS